MYTRLHNHARTGLFRRLTIPQQKYSTGILNKKDSVNNISENEKVHGFICKQVEYIKEFDMTAYFLQHDRTLTEYLHLGRADSNNVFSVGFRTTPLDSMGTPHILEHTVLCGSEKFPVRDPFFKMLNRSLATFMNALTGPDYTFYPFSSQNEVDYRNLQNVYLDAVFKPNLSRLDFLQEGWRLEHANVEDQKSELTLKGVVYNEMKGAFSENSSYFSQQFVNTILPTGTYGHVSGGDPLQIPHLSHEFLKNFHAKYYHPSNARFFSYGNFPLEPNLKFVNEEYLTNYDYFDPSVTVVQPQPRWTEPRHSETACRVDQYGGVPIEKQNQIAIGYIMSDITNVYDTFVIMALAELMLIGPNSPFYKSLIEKNFSGGYNSLTGYDNQIRDTLFVVGLRDIEESKFEMMQSLVDQTLQKLHKNGFDNDHIESVLQGFELSIKHQTPKFGLNLLFNLMPLWNHNGPILEALQVNNLLTSLKKDLKNPQYVRDMIEKYFLNNSHKLVMTMKPDPKFDENLNAAEAMFVKSKITALTPEQKENIYREGLELSKAQKAHENLEILPCLSIEDITLTKTAPSISHTASVNIPLQLCEANTNGVAYFRGVLGSECLDDKQRDLLPFFNYVVAKFDTRNYNYRDFDKYVSKTTSGLSFLTHITEHIDQYGQYEQGVVISSYCLNENLSKMMDIWAEIFNKPDFSNTERMKMLLTTYCSSLSSGVIDAGHTYAMQLAKSLVSSVDECKEKLLGINHITTMQDIHKNQPIEYVQNTIHSMSELILSGQNLRTAFHFSTLSDEKKLCIEHFCKKMCKDSETTDINRINWTDCKDMTKENRGVHVQIQIPVNFCAKAIPTVPYTHADYPKLRVLSKFLTSKYLHPIVREQNGAYGGGALISMDGIFTYYSYRDPNTNKTLDVYDNTTNWMKENCHLLDKQTLFESTISILQQMDQPIPEYMKGIDLFLYGLSYDIWKTQRERILSVKCDDLLEVCEKYLGPEKWSGKCVIGAESEGLSKDKETWTTITGPQQ